MRHPIKSLLVTIALVIATVLIGNYVLVHRHLASILKTDPRNEGVVAYAYYNHFVIPGTLVFDLRSVGPENSPADIFRVVLQFAAAHKSSEYSTVRLAFRGETKFILKGDYFHTLGVEFSAQNPVYTMRTFPENLYRPDGSAAFGTWTGGLLGVFGKQIEDFTEFHKQWYINELAKTGS